MKFFATAVTLLAAACLLISGCDVLGSAYPEATLDQIMKRAVKSGTDRYRLDHLRVVASRANTGIVRDGSYFVIVIGPGLKKAMAEHDPSQVDYGVHVVRQPRTHLVLERIFTADGEIDLFAGEVKVASRMPDIVNSGDIPFNEYRADPPLDRTDPTDTRVLRGVPGRKLNLRDFHIEKRVIEESCREYILAVKDSPKPEKPRYVLTTETGCDLLVLNEDSMTGLILDFLIADKRRFKGGAVVEDIFNQRARESCDITGSAKLEWVDLGGTLFCRVR